MKCSIAVFSGAAGTTNQIQTSIGCLLKFTTDILFNLLDFNFLLVNTSFK